MCLMLMFSMLSCFQSPEMAWKANKHEAEMVKEDNNRKCEKCNPNITLWCCTSWYHIESGTSVQWDERMTGLWRMAAHFNILLSEIKHTYRQIINESSHYRLSTVTVIVRAPRSQVSTARVAGIATLFAFSPSHFVMSFSNFMHWCIKKNDDKK